MADHASADDEQTRADDAENAVTTATVLTADASAADGPVYKWAPPAPTKRKHHAGLWTGGIAVVVIGGLVAASLVLIAPGTAIAGVSVGGMTTGAAAEAVSSRLAQTQIVLTGAGDDAIVTGAQLGAHVDAQSLAQSAFEDRPMWNPAAWFAGASHAEVTIDDETASAALQKAVPSLYEAAVNAEVEYDPATHAYTVTPGVPGTGIDLEAVQEALQGAFATGKPTVDLSVGAVPVQAKTTTEAAQKTADTLNAMAKTAGFYVGAERTVPISADTLASWLTLSVADDGSYSIVADEAAIQTTVDTLTTSVDRKVVDASVVTDGNGKTLKTLKKGLTGRVLGPTTGIASAFAAQLAQGNASFALTVAETQPKSVEVQRLVEVDLSRQRVWLRENGKVVSTSLVSTGRPGHATITGTFHVYAKLTIQNMGNKDLKKAPNYYTENVPWVMYFNGDQALHGAYWHHNFGHVMSHGCVNLPVGYAKQVFDFVSVGTTVWVHN